jgi:RNA polymerase sigma-70 factor, ECF subfamily
MSTPLRRSSHLPTESDSRDPLAERAWIEGIVAGDERAFEAVFRRFNRELYRFAVRMLGSPDEAEDVVQGVFVAIWQNRATWVIRSGLRVYLFTAVRNRVLQQFRNSRVRRGLEPEILAITGARLSGPFTSPEAQVEQVDFAAALATAVAALPPRCREAFMLTREHGLTYAEAGAVMGVSPNTVMVQIGRALATLRRSLAPFLLSLLIIR